MPESIQTISQRLLAREGRTEQDIQADIRSFILEADLNVEDVDIADVSLEAQVGGGRRIDVEVGRTVIEVKKQDLVKNPKAKQKAVNQLEGYVRDRALASSHRYVGVLSDGVNWNLYTLGPDNSLVLASEFILSRTSEADRLAVWLEGVLATSEQVKPTPDEVEQRLGYRSSSFQLDLVDLTTLYELVKDEPEVVLKRELWARLLTSALGTNFTDTDELFIRHTYLVLAAELIAHAVVGFNIAEPDLNGYDLLAGRLFREAGISGVVEADFFDWPVENPRGEPLVRTIAKRLSRFDWTAAEHDVLKVLYESVIDAKTRKSLGEYYTPDWLAERIVDEVVTDPLTQTVLDPACGSGTFLFWAVRRHLEAADQAGLSNTEAINSVVRHVYGVDLHPVAVTLARVTYLLAIGLGRLQDRDSFTVPVYLGDSVQWDEDHSLLTAGGLRLQTKGGAQLFTQELFFPGRVLDDAGNFDRLMSALMDKATGRARGSNVPDISGVLSAHGVHPDDRGELTATFETLCRLHDDRDDHIWGYYVRNRARPAWLTRAQNRVDVLVGNPPWLAYRYMPQGMQDAFKTMSADRHLWTGGKSATHADLSDLFVVRAVELYLKQDGDFGLVMPAAVLSRRQYQGFRLGDYVNTQRGVNHTIAFGQSWDMTGIEPTIFPVPSSVVFGSRGGAAFPMPEKTAEWHGKLVSHHSTWHEIESLLSQTDGLRADTEIAKQSEYAPAFRQGATLVPRVLTVVQKQEAGPLGVPAGLVAVDSARSNLEKEPWKSIDTVRGAVERDFVYRAHFGTSVAPFRCFDPLHTVIPWRSGRLVEGQAVDSYPGMSAWWAKASSEWDAHKTSADMSLLERIDYHKEMSAQFPIADHRVVYTGSGKNLTAARLSDPTAVVEHKLYWGPVGSVEEARYLCAILNSQVVLNIVRPLQSEGQFGPRDFDKYVFAAPIPLFRNDDSLHIEIAEKGERAEGVAAEVDVGDYGFQKARRLIREALIDDGVAAEIEKLVDRVLTSTT